MRVRRRSEPVDRAALALSVCLALGRAAAAEAEAVRIDYVAPAPCPDATAFLRALRRRTTQYRTATKDEQARRFVVRVTALASLFSGRLEICGPDGSVAVRSVDAPACDEVSNALALMAAVAIDPNALTGNPKNAVNGPAESAPEPAPGPQRQSPPPSRPEAYEQSPPRVAAVVSQAVLPKTQVASSPWQWSAGLMGHATFELSPTLGYGGDLFVDAEAPAASFLGSSVRMGIFLNRWEVDLPGGPGASFDWVAASWDGCPVRLSLVAATLTVHPCVVFRLGALHGEGRHVTKPMQRLSLWSDVGAVLRLRFLATARLIVEAQGGVLLPLHRPSFEIQEMNDTRTMYSVPGFGGSAGLGAAYRFR